VEGAFRIDGRLTLYTRDEWDIGWERHIEPDADGGRTFDLRHSGGWSSADMKKYRVFSEDDGLQLIEDYAEWYAKEKWPTPEFPVRFIMPSGRVVAVPFR
jgi:hypothetical protein